MDCGICGNLIVPGYTTCGRCRATLVSRRVRLKGLAAWIVVIGGLWWMYEGFMHFMAILVPISEFCCGDRRSNPGCHLLTMVAVFLGIICAPYVVASLLTLRREIVWVARL
jgi:hypothetical protein